MSKKPSAPSPTPPIAVKDPVRSVVHGDERVDDYHWLRRKDDPQVIAHLEAEDAYASAVMSATADLQERLYQEFLGRIKETDASVPYREGDHLYYRRTEEGKQYPIYCRKGASGDAPEQVLLDLNQLAEGEAFMALDEFEVSSDGRHLAYTIDNTGFREYQLQIKDLDSGQVRPESLERVETVAWAADGRTLFYTREDHAKRPYRIYRHRLGAPHEEDELLYEEEDERFRVSVRLSRSRAYVFLGSHSHTTSEVRFVPADRPNEAPRLIAPRQPGHEYHVDHRGDLFFVRTNDAGRNFRVVTAPVADPGRDRWRELVPHREEVMLEGIDLFESHYVLREREDGLPHLALAAAEGGERRRVTMPEEVYSVFPGPNPQFSARRYRFHYQSLTTPPSVYEVDARTLELELLKETEVLGGYDPSRYVARRLHATAGDGTRIPISIVYRRDALEQGPAPMLLTGYGSYGFPYPIVFSHARPSLLDRGVAFAVAHVRGGGEMGKRWHDEGRMLAKKNTFTDFIAVSEHLVREGYTASDRLVIQGGSAGGLLMGAVTNMRPELFHAVVSLVPFVDVINTMLDADLPLTVGEFEEWGNPKLEDQYRCMVEYCPYTNIAPRDYPAILVKTSYNDSQVMYWEPAKYVAKLRANKTDDRPLLFKINMSGGHSGSSGRYDRIREVAVDYAFILWQLGRG